MCRLLAHNLTYFTQKAVFHIWISAQTIEESVSIEVILLLFSFIPRFVKTSKLALRIQHFLFALPSVYISSKSCVRIEKSSYLLPLLSGMKPVVTQAIPPKTSRTQMGLLRPNLLKSITTMGISCVF